jgi:hypothetical protein
LRRNSSSAKMLSSPRVQVSVHIERSQRRKDFCLRR